MNDTAERNADFVAAARQTDLTPSQIDTVHACAEQMKCAPLHPLSAACRPSTVPHPLHCWFHTRLCLKPSNAETCGAIAFGELSGACGDVQQCVQAVPAARWSRAGHHHPQGVLLRCAATRTRQLSQHTGCRTRGCDSGAGGGVMLSGWGLRALPSKPSTQTLQPQFWTELASWCMGCLRTLGTLRALTATACPLECPPANRRTSWTRLRG